jgi:hypothetical protein
MKTIKHRTTKSDAPLVLGLSGPDGAGKTTLQHRVHKALVADGLTVHLGYGYGCFLCRRINRPSGVAGAACAQGAPPNDQSSRQRPAPARRGTFSATAHLLRTTHGHVDALELTGRLLVLRLAAPKSRPRSVILTDRGPLDGLAKHDPPPGSTLARQYLRAAATYDAIVVLDAPGDVLAQRDGEHSPEELEHWRLLYRRWAKIAGTAGAPVTSLDTASQPVDLITDHVLRLVKESA